VGALARAAAAAPRRAGVVGVAAAALAAVTAWMAYEVRESYGGIALAASPGVGWLGPAAAAALVAGLAAAPMPRAAAKLAAKA
jgi:hypothetical protein